MVEAPGAQTVAPPRLPRLWVAVVHYGTTAVGYFGLMAVLVVALHRQGLRADEVAAAVAVFSVCSKVAKIPLAVVMDRIAPHVSLLVGCVLAGALLAVLPAARTFPAVVAVLVIAGLGVSVNALASKQLAARATDAAASRTTAFAVINVSVNLASAVAAPLALLLLDAGRTRMLFIAVGAAYVVAGIASCSLLRRVEWPPPSRQGWAAYRGVLATPRLAPLLAVNAAGWFLYAQLFNSVPLYVTERLGAGAELGLLFTTNALLIVVFQVPFGRAVEHLGRGMPRAMLAMAFALFAAAFVLGGALPGFVAVVALVVVFSFAEMAFVPTVDVALLETIDDVHRAAGYSVLSVATAIGEASGAAVGITMFAWMHDRGADGGFWYVAAGAAVAAGVLAGLTARRNPRKVPA